MARLTLKEILEIPQLSFLMEPQEFGNFIPNRTDATQILNAYNALRTDVILFPGFFGINTDMNSEGYFSKDRDCLVSAGYARVMKEQMLKNKSKISPDLLLLFLGGLAHKYFRDLGNKQKYTEIMYTNGNILVAQNGSAILKRVEGSEDVDIDKVKEDLAEGILIARKNLQEHIRRNKILKISGLYKLRGRDNTVENFSYSTQELDTFCKSREMFKALSLERIESLYKRNIITQHEIVKAIKEGFISKTDAVLLLKVGVIREEELLRKVFNAKRCQDVVKSPNESLETKIAMYTTGLIDIKTLEEAANLAREQEKNSRTNTANENAIGIPDSFFEKIAKHYNMRKIGELLLHNVLSYDESKRFLKVLEKKQVIDENEKKSLEKSMYDFREGVLYNSVEMETLDGDGNGKRYPKAPRITIDPELRLEYLKSIGAIKRVKIKGEIAIQDERTGKSKKKLNSLDGYELLIIPDKKVAVLEKFYEVTRDSEGHIVYKTNQNGELIPATENATYILPLDMAKDLIESRNKKQLIKLPYVKRAFHIPTWSSEIESKIKSMNPEAKFDKKKSEEYLGKTVKSYNENKKKVEEQR